MCPLTLPSYCHIFPNAILNSGTNAPENSPPVTTILIPVSKSDPSTPILPNLLYPTLLTAWLPNQSLVNMQ